MYAISVNSATSGLLVSCMAVGVTRQSEVIVPAMSMSATAAVPAFLGAKVRFADIEPDTFCLDLASTKELMQTNTKAVIAVNLFGHPARLHELRKLCDDRSVYLIEDNAQAPFAKEDDKYAGTIGHVGVFSSNVHKFIHSGEGGVCVTNDEKLADRMRLARNHSEMAGMGPGLNLRMTEVTAAILYQQLLKGPQIVSERIEIAEAMTEMVKGMPMLIPPVVRDGCTHSYYIWALKCTLDRKRFVEAMQAEGVPLREGYVAPLYRLPAFWDSGVRPGTYPSHCPIAETMQYASMITYENCAYSPSKKQLRQFREAFKKVCDHAHKW